MKERILNLENVISTLTQAIDSLETRLSDVEGNVSTVTQTVNAIISETKEK